MIDTVEADELFFFFTHLLGFIFFRRIALSYCVVSIF